MDRETIANNLRDYDGQDVYLLHEDAGFTAPGTVHVLDSSFNPPNRAHLTLVHDAVAREPACSVLLLFAVNNADKGSGLDMDELNRRVAMMVQFWLDCVDTVPGGSGIPCAIGVTRHARFVDKFAAIRGAFPGEVCFLTGFDTLWRLFDPKYYPHGVVQELGQMMLSAQFQALTREPDTVSKTPETMARSVDDQLQWVDRIKSGQEPELPGDWGHRIHLVKSTAATRGVNSSAARQAVNHGHWQEVQRVVPPLVQQYIVQHGLYK